MISIVFLFSLLVLAVDFDFEDDSQLPTVLNNPHSNPKTVSITKDKFKEGSTALGWEWNAGENNMGEVLEWDLEDNVEGRPARLGGIKFHLYNIQPIFGKCLKMCITQQGFKVACR